MYAVALPLLRNVSFTHFAFAHAVQRAECYGEGAHDFRQQDAQRRRLLFRQSFRVSHPAECLWANSHNRRQNRG